MSSGFLRYVCDSTRGEHARAATAPSSFTVQAGADITGWAEEDEGVCRVSPCVWPSCRTHARASRIPGRWIGPVDRPTVPV